MSRLQDSRPVQIHLCLGIKESFHRNQMLLQNVGDVLYVIKSSEDYTPVRWLISFNILTKMILTKASMFRKVFDFFLMI